MSEQFEGGYYMEDGSEQLVGDAAMLEEEDGHLRVDDLWGTQTVRVLYSVTAAPEDLANNPELAVVKIPEQGYRHLKKVTTTTNRSAATSADLTGDLARAIVLSAKVTQARNTFDRTIGVDISGMMPTCVTGNGCHNFVLLGKMAPTVMDKEIFEPDSIFSQHDYVKYGKLSHAGLARDLVLAKDGKSPADIVIGSVAWNVLVNNAKDGRYDDALVDELADAEYNAGNSLLRKAQLPHEIASELFEAIKAPLDTIDQSFHDMRKTNARFLPVDGKGWNSFETMVGDGIGLASDDGLALEKHVLNTPCTAEVEVEYTFVTFPEEE